MGSALENRVKAVIARHFKLPPSKVRLDAAFVDALGGDPLDLIELGYQLEAAFNVRSPRPSAIPCQPSAQSSTSFVGRRMFGTNDTMTLNREILAKIAREAGCHIYADENYVVLHASRTGRKTIRLRSKCSPWEVYEKKSYGQGTDVIEAVMAFGETKMWQLKR